MRHELGPAEFEILRHGAEVRLRDPAFGPVYQLGAGLAYLERVGVDRIEAHTIALAHRLAARPSLPAASRLTTPEGNRSSIVAFRVARPRSSSQSPRGNPTQVSVREKGTQIRVSPALFNTESDIDRFLALAEHLR